MNDAEKGSGVSDREFAGERARALPTYSLQPTAYSLAKRLAGRALGAGPWALDIEVRAAHSGHGPQTTDHGQARRRVPTSSPQPPASSLCAALLLLCVPAAAWAHAETGAASGLLSGLSHPVSGLDHVLAMVAVGLWGAQLGSPAIWQLPVAFPLLMAVGGFLGLIGVPLPGVEIGIALSAVLLGVMVLFEVRPPLAAAIALVAFFAIFHGHAHGTELPAGQSGLTYSIGFVMATGLLHALGIAIGLLNRWTAGRLVLRGTGALVAAGGVYFLVSAIA